MIDFTPMLTAAPVIQLHVLTAGVAIVLAPVNLLRRRRDRIHRALGYAWVIAMATCALSSFWISGIRMMGPFSPIHLLSLLTFYSLWTGLRFARRGQLEAHRASFRGLTLYGLAGAGGFAFLPGRLMNEVFFPNIPALGYLILAMVGVAAGLHISFGGGGRKLRTQR